MQAYDIQAYKTIFLTPNYRTLYSLRHLLMHTPHNFWRILPRPEVLPPAFLR
jgi:hypothetical protein